MVHADFLVTFTKVAHGKDAGKCKVTLSEEYLAKNKAFYNEFDHKFWGKDNESLPTETPVKLSIEYYNRDRPVVAQDQEGEQGGEQPRNPGEEVPTSPPGSPRLRRGVPLELADGVQVARLPALAPGLGAAIPEFVAIKKKRAKAPDILHGVTGTDGSGRSAV